MAVASGHRVDGPPRVFALGGLRVVVSGKELRLRTRKEAMLLLLLAIRAPVRVSRDEFVQILWPDSSERRARHSLSEALRGVEQATGIPVDRNPDSLAVAENAVWTDVRELRAALERGDVEQASKLYVGGFLSGWYPPTAPASHWVDATAEELRSALERMTRTQLASRRQATDSRGVAAAVALLERLGAANDADREAAAEADQITGWESLPSGDPVPTRVPIDREGPFVGRTEEMRVLTEELEHALAGELRIVLVAGEAGIGKTRTCQRLARLAALRGARLFLSSCYELEQSVAFGAISEAFAGSITASDIAALKPAWRDVLGDVLPEVGGLVSSSSATAAVPDSRSMWIFQAVLGLVESMAAERTSFLLIDDLQWADSSTCRLLHFVARKAKPPAGALIVLSYRREDIIHNEPASVLARSLAAAPVELSRMTDHEIEAQIALLTASISRSDVDRIVSRAGGNPLFARELAVSHRGASLPDRLPDSVRELVARKTAKLNELPSQIVDVIAVAGGRLRLEALSQILRRELVDLLAPVSALRSAGLVREDGGAITIAHDLLRDGVYACLTDASRRNLHILIAERSAGFMSAASRAAHFDLGAAAPQACDMALRAVADTAAKYASDERLDLLALALRNAAGEQQLEIAGNFTDLCFAFGEYRRVLDVLGSIGQPLNTRLRIKRDLALLKVSTLRDFTSFEDLLAQVDDLLSRAGIHSPVDFVETARERIRLAYEAGDDAIVVSTIDELQAFAADSGRTREAARALCFASYQSVFYRPGANVSSGLQLAESIAKEVNDIETQVKAGAGLAQWLIVQGKTNDAATCVSKTLAIARGQRLLAEELQVRLVAMAVCTDQRNFRRALRHAAIVRGRADEDRALPAMWAALNASVCYLEMGEPAAAIVEADVALAMERTHPAWPIRVGATSVKGLAALDLGKLQAAIECRDTVLSEAPSLDKWTDDPTYAIALVARVGWHCGASAETLDLLNQAAQAYKGRNLSGYWASVIEHARLSKRLGLAADNDTIREVYFEALSEGNKLLAQKALEALETASPKTGLDS